jgi:hypothetical protein
MLTQQVAIEDHFVCLRFAGRKARRVLEAIKSTAPLLGESFQTRFGPWSF